MEEKKATEATGETVEENKEQEAQDKTVQAAEKKEGEQQSQDPAADGNNAESEQKKDPPDADGGEEDVSAGNGGKKGSKKIFLLLFLVAVVILAFAAGIAAAVLVPRLLEQRRIAAELKALEAPDFYFTEEDAVSSVTVILGERRYEKFLEDIFEDGTVIRETQETETTAEETETLSQSVQEEEGTEGTGTESTEATETATQEETVQPVVREVYQYYPQEEGGIQTDIREYMEYLQSEKNFLDISDIMDADKEMEGVADLLEEEGSQAQGYWLVGPAANAESYLILSIVQYPEYYQIRTKVGEESFTQYVAGLWEERDQVQTNVGLPNTGQQPSVTSPGVPTKQYLEEKIASMSQEELKLPEPTENYEFMVNNGAVYVGETEYFRVTAYRPNEEGTLSYECTYLMDIDGNLRYTYDEVTGEATPFP